MAIRTLHVSIVTTYGGDDSILFVQIRRSEHFHSLYLYQPKVPVTWFCHRIGLAEALNGIHSNTIRNTPKVGQNLIVLTETTAVLIIMDAKNVNKSPLDDEKDSDDQD